MDTLGRTRKQALDKAAQEYLDAFAKTNSDPNQTLTSDLRISQEGVSLFNLNHFDLPGNVEEYEPKIEIRYSLHV